MIPGFVPVVLHFDMEQGLSDCTFYANGIKDIHALKKHPRNETRECFSAAINTAISVSVYYHMPEN